MLRHRMFREGEDVAGRETDSFVKPVPFQRPPGRVQKRRARGAYAENYYFR